MSEFEYVESTRGKCPHCQTVVMFTGAEMIPKRIGDWYPTEMKTKGGHYQDVYIYSSQCPNCLNPIVFAKITLQNKKIEKYLAVPRNIVRVAPPEVPAEIRDDFLEATAVISISEKASAALSRRCLQNLLREKGFTQRDLNDQIDAALKELPTRIGENLDAVRQIGNYAAHPLKHQSTGLIVDVEPAEASWTLDVLEDLFDFYYVQPKKAEEKRKKLDEKLKSLGKPPMKKP